MDGFRLQSLSDTTKSPSIANQIRSLPSTIAAAPSASVLNLNTNRTLRNPIHQFSQPTIYRPSMSPSAGTASLLGVSSSRQPFPVTSFHSSCHSFPFPSKSLLKEERSCSSISFSSSSASDSDYDSAPLRPSSALQRLSDDKDVGLAMVTHRYEPTNVALGSDEALLFKPTTTEETMIKPEDENRKSIRRERNKQAAARCRQRRVDLMNHLMAETETLDTVRSDLEREVENLLRLKNQLEFILQAHTTQCRMVLSSSSSPGSITQLVKMESSVTGFLRPPSASSNTRTLGSTTSMQERFHNQQRQAGELTLNSSNQTTPMGSANQMTLANHMPLITSANHTKLSMNTSSSMSCATATLPTTSDAEPLLSPMTLDALSSFAFDTSMLEAQLGPTRVIGIPSTLPTSVLHTNGDGISPNILNL